MTLHLYDGCATHPKPLSVGSLSARISGAGRFTVLVSNPVFRLRLVGRLAGHRIRHGSFRLRAPGPKAGQTCDSGSVTYRAALRGVGARA